MEQIKKSIENMINIKVCVLNIQSIKQFNKFLDLREIEVVKNSIYIIEKNKITEQGIDFRKFKYICLYRESQLLFTKPLKAVFEAMVENREVECPICLSSPNNEATICQKCGNVICNKCIVGLFNVVDNLDENTRVNCPFCRHTYSAIAVI